MRTDATTIAPEATLDEARQALAAHGESLPVVDADGHVEGPRCGPIAWPWPMARRPRWPR
jgi:CBS-domain-containing membrane protein